MNIEDRVFDTKLDLHGIVEDVSDPHNVLVRYLKSKNCISSGSGLYCIVKTCVDYEPQLILEEELHAQTPNTKSSGSLPDSSPSSEV